MRIKVKNVLSSTAFIAILLVLLILLSQVVKPKDNSKESGMIDPMANGILAEPENTIDVLMLGDSESYCAFMPMKIWSEHGITSYVCGTSAQLLSYTEEFLHKSFKTQKPKIVILETNIIFRKFSATNIISQEIKNLFPVFTYHNRWKSLQLSDFSPEVNYTSLRDSKGYRLNKTVKASYLDKSYMKPSKDKSVISSLSASYVKKIKAYCDKNGAKFILVSTPSTKNWNYKRHNSIDSLAKALNVEYIDMNLLQKEIPIDWAKDTRDAGDHMNYFGALKVSSYLGDYLAKQNMFIDKRKDTSFDEWNQALDRFKALVHNTALNSRKDNSKSKD